MSLTIDLSERVADLAVPDVTGSDLAAVRTLLLDHIAVAANGSRTDSALAAQHVAARVGGTDGVTLPIVGTRSRAAVLRAITANAVAAHSIEYDDTHSPASSHPGVVIFPAALGAAAVTGADASAFVRGVFAGYEVMCRLGRAANPPAQYARHFHPTATTGHIGAAAACGVIAGFGAEKLNAAMGIAATMAGGSMEFLADGAWTKRLHPGMAAANGLEAALLADEGFIGPRDAIGGEEGFLATMSADPRPDELFAEWGERPAEVRNTGIKAHACCRYNQGPLDAVLEMLQKHDLDPADVASVVIGLPSVAVPIVAEPLARKRRPKSVVDAQFSMPFAAAVALQFGRAGLDEYVVERLGDDSVRRLMDLVVCVADVELDRTYPQQWRAWARIETSDGSMFEARVDDPKGDPANPLSLEELRNKFDVLTGGVYSQQRRAAIADTVGRIGGDGTLDELVDLLPGDL